MKTLAAVTLVMTISAPAFAAATVKSLTLNSRVPSTTASICGGQTIDAVVTLSEPAPLGPTGLTVQISSDHPDIRLPATVTVPVGQTSQTFTVSTQGVATSTRVTLAAQHGLATQRAVLIVELAAVRTVALAGPIVGGTKHTGTVTLTCAAPPSGLSVPLTSSDRVVTVPTSILVPGGASSGTFSVTTSGVAADTTVTIGAGTPAVTSQLVINPPTVASLRLGSTTAAGGATVGGTVTLTGPAPAGGLYVYTSSSTPAASVPYSVQVPAGQMSTAFTVTTAGVSAEAIATIMAGNKVGTKAASADLTIKPPVLTALTLSQASAPGNFAVGATVTLDAPAPSGGLTIPLSSSSPTGASVPASVTVPQGQTASTFDVMTASVASDVTTTITAGTGQAARSAQLTITGAPVVSSLVTSGNSMTTGGTFTGWVYLNKPAPAGGFLVPISISPSSAGTAPVNVTVPQGQSSVSFSIPTSVVPEDTRMTIIVGEGTTAKSAEVLLVASVMTDFLLGGSLGTYDPVQNVSHSNVGRNINVIGGADKLNLDIKLNVALPGQSRTAEISSSDPAVSVPSTMTIPPSYGNAVLTVDTMSVGSDVPVTITARLGNITKSATVTLKPIALDSVALTAFQGGNAQFLRGGKTAIVNVRLNANAPAGGLTVPLVSSHPDVFPVPSTVTVTQNTIGHGQTLVTTEVAEDTTVTVTAGTGTNARTASITVQSLKLQSLSVGFQSITGGSPITGSVTLNDKAPAAGFVVPLSSNIAEATVPASVTVPANQSSANFQITTSTVTANTTGTITAGTGSLAKTVNILLRP